MIETRIGGVEWTSETKANTDPWLIALFGNAYSGKTRLALTGPDPIGAVVLEMKSYKTLSKHEAETGKVVFKPRDPLALMVNPRKIAVMENDVQRQLFYREHCKKVEDALFGLLEHKDVRLVMVDKFSQYCVWKELAVNGPGGNLRKIDGKLVQVKKEFNQAVIDVMMAVSAYKKPVLFMTGAKGDYDVVDAQRNPLRNTWECGSFYDLGYHTNLAIEMAVNETWNPDGKDNNRWRYRLNVRKCQVRTELEGPMGNPLLQEDEITLPQLIAQVDPEADIGEWL